jgi:hypothetical protein
MMYPGMISRTSEMIVLGHKIILAAHVFWVKANGIQSANVKCSTWCLSSVPTKHLVFRGDSASILVLTAPNVILSLTTTSLHEVQISRTG